MKRRLSAKDAEILCWHWVALFWHIMVVEQKLQQRSSSTAAVGKASDNGHKRPFTRFWACTEAFTHFMLPGTTIALQLTSPGHHLLHHDHHHHHPYVQVNALHVPNHRPLVFLCAPQERAVIQLKCTQAGFVNPAHSCCCCGSREGPCCCCGIIGK